MRTESTRHMRKRIRAQSIAEFALIIPVLMLILLGIIAFGQLFSYRIRMDNAAREGARKGIVGGTKAQIDTIVRHRLNSLPGANNTVCANQSPCLLVSVLPDDNGGARTIGGDLVVALHYEAFITVPVIGFMMSPKILMARSAMRIEALP